MQLYDPLTSPYLPASPMEDAERIVAIETVIPSDIMPGLMLIRVHTENGIVGHGETYYVPHAVAAMIHDWMARRLVGQDALAIESHWRFLYERSANFGVRGAELRAISAIDLALWDILGQKCGQPVYRLLGGPVRYRVPVYNSLGNPNYGRNPEGVPLAYSLGNLGAVLTRQKRLPEAEAVLARGWKIYLRSLPNQAALRWSVSPTPASSRRSASIPRPRPC